jgi:hypothetical protein
LESLTHDDRYLFAFSQVVPIDAAETERRKAAAAKGVVTRVANMEREMATVKLTIQRGWSDLDIYDLAYETHGGNYEGNPGEFYFNNRKARNTIRHKLTNYEAQWERINRGETGERAYQILRARINALVDEAYPRFAEGMPEVRI